jgi:hypothetical protein
MAVALCYGVRGGGAQLCFHGTAGNYDTDTLIQVLVVERLPASAPELNPTEGLWSNLKAVELANLTCPTLAEVIQQAHRGIDRVRGTPHLAYAFLRHAGLSVA